MNFGMTTLKKSRVKQQNFVTLILTGHHIHQN